MLEVPSPYRPEYLLKNPGLSPAFNFNDSSYRRNQGQTFFFDPFSNNQGSVQKTPDNMYFSMNPNSSSKKFKNVFSFDQKLINNHTKSAFNIPRNVNENSKKEG